MPKKLIVFYDGVCGLCDRSVQFLIKQDTDRKLRYAALQSQFAAQTLKQPMAVDSFVLLVDDKIYTQSTAALTVLYHIGGFWKLTALFFIVPRFIRDAVYKWVAKNRYRWFGKYDSCKIPDAGQRALFLDV